MCVGEATEQVQAIRCIYVKIVNIVDLHFLSVNILECVSSARPSFPRLYDTILDPLDSRETT